MVLGTMLLGNCLPRGALSHKWHKSVRSITTSSQSVLKEVVGQAVLLGNSDAQRPPSKQVSVDYRAAKETLRAHGYVRIPLGAASSPKDAEHVARVLTDTQNGGGDYNVGGGVQRGSLEGSAFLDAAEGAPASLRIQPHNEMAYARSFPEHVSFLMMRPAKEGGLTELYDNARLTRRLGESQEGCAILGKMQTLGIQYIRLLHDQADKGKPGFYNEWESSYATEDYEEALRKANDPHDSFAMACDDVTRQQYAALQMPAPRMRVVTWAPSMVTHDRLGEIVFTSVLNRHASWLDGHADFGLLPHSARPYQCRWGDGTELSQREVDEIRSAYEDCRMSLALDRGDLIVLDNLYVEHGRAPFVAGPERRLMGLLLGRMVDREPSRDAPPSAFSAAADEQRPRS